MKQTLTPGPPIHEHSDRHRQIKLDIEHFLTTLARDNAFTWTAPTLNIVTHLIHAIQEFKPAAEEEP